MFQVKLLYDLVYANPKKTKLSLDKTENIFSTGGMRTVLTRGGPLDIGFHHTDPNRCKMTLEMYVSFGSKYGMKKEKSDSICLAMRTFGQETNDPKGIQNLKKFGTSSSSHLKSLKSFGVMWSLSVDSEGALSFSMVAENKNKSGSENQSKKENANENNSEYVVKTGPGSIIVNNTNISKNKNRDNESGNKNENDNENENVNENDDMNMNTSLSAVWYHIAIVIDSNLNDIDNDNSNNNNNNNTNTNNDNNIDRYPTSANISLYINSDKVASGHVTIPSIKESILDLPGCLYICPCLPVGSRVTELRVVRTFVCFLSIMVVPCCTVLYCIVLYCIVLYCIVLYCIVLYCIILYCILSN